MAPAAAQAQKPVYTDQKAIRLINVFSAIIFVAFLLGWMHVVLIQPMKKDADAMAHMDPSEIRAIPYSLERLTAFCMFPAVIVMFMWLVRSPDKITSNILSFVRLSLVTYALFGLCGAQIVHYWQHSATAAIYIAALLSTTWTDTRAFNVMEELPFADLSDLLKTSRLYGTLIVMIPFQIITILDKGDQAQRWPLPIVLGGTYGYVIGTMVGIVLSKSQIEAKHKQKK